MGARSTGKSFWADCVEPAVTRAEKLRLDSNLSSLIRDFSDFRPAEGSGSHVTTIHFSKRRWQDEAACLDMNDGHGHTDFVPELPLDEAGWERVAAAKAVCSICPVTGACESYARRHKASGVWGGILIDPEGRKIGRPKRVR